MYQNTKLFWVTIVAVAILSMFHSPISQGEGTTGNAATLYGYSECPPELKINTNNRFRPIWYWEMNSFVKKCKYQLDGGKAVESFKGSFQPNIALSPGPHTFKVIFTCVVGKEAVEVEYNTSTARMTEKTDRQDDLDTDEKANKPNTSMLDPANGGQREQLLPTPTNGEQGALPHLAPDDGEYRARPHAPVNEQGAIVPHVPDKNVCDDKPPRKFTMSGRIVDANTGRGISGAKFVVLVPGTLVYEYDAFLDSSSILSQAVTDKSGNYTLSRQLRNRKKYSMFINADGYKRKKLDEQVMESCGKSLNNNFKLRSLH